MNRNPPRPIAARPSSRGQGRGAARAGLGLHAGLLACLPVSASLDLDGYDALRGVRATLSVRVSCDRPDDRFRLDLGPIGQGGDTLRLQGPGGTLVAGVTQAGQPWRSGTQVVRFPLNILAGQWVAGGTYRAALEVTVVNERQETP